MTRRPKNIDIMGIRYRIEYKPVIGEGGVSGQVSFLDRLIEISTNENRTPDELESTLIHEIIHAILHTSGVTELFPKRQREQLDEAVTTAIENGLKPLVRLNLRKNRSPR